MGREDLTGVEGDDRDLPLVNGSVYTSRFTGTCARLSRMSRLTCRRSVVAYVVNPDTLAPTRSTFFHADDAGPEGRVPASRRCVSGQRERVRSTTRTSVSAAAAPIRAEL